jgi:quinol monooxygenase YgiN
MHALLVTFKIKPEHRERFIKAAEDDSICSMRDEPGCLRFEVYEDQSDPNGFYFLEVYRDEAAFQAHQQTPHYARWLEARQVVVETAQRTMLTPRFPSDQKHWG